jgi:GT2 family glycosyltransferase
MSPAGDVGIVIASRDRRESLLRSLSRLDRLPERPPVVVVDNASGDGTAEAVRAAFPTVTVVALSENRGAAARNVGAGVLRTAAIAFCDDDSWWEPGAIALAGDRFRRFPKLGLIAGQILVGPQRRLDPTSALMAGFPPPDLPGPRIHGFVACGAIVRRAAFLQAGGFCERFGIGGEEGLLALELHRDGWELCYDHALIAVHEPDPSSRVDRRWQIRRNDLWTSWLRRPLDIAARDTLALVRDARRDDGDRRALTSALAGLPWAVAHRHRRLGRSRIGA